MGESIIKNNTIKMKIFNIVSTVTLFSSTFSWARDLKDLKVELEKQHKEFDFVVKYLE